MLNRQYTMAIEATHASIDTLLLFIHYHVVIWCRISVKRKNPVFYDQFGVQNTRIYEPRFFLGRLILTQEVACFTKHLVSIELRYCMVCIKILYLI